MKNDSAILLVGHGTRDSVGIAEFGELARLVAARTAPVPVYSCYLELAAPTIDVAVSEAVAKGARRLVVAPILLFAAGHAKRDIPSAIENAVASAAVNNGYRVTWRQTGVLDGHAEVLELSVRRYREAIDAATERTAPEARDTCLVLVGRGSHDAEAVAAMREFAKRRAAATPVARCDVAFMAMADPHYGEVLRAAGELGHARIVVQPHLLFQGELADRLRSDVASLAREYSASQWIVTRHLGPDALLADAVASLCRGELQAT